MDLGALMSPGGKPGDEPQDGTWSDLVKDPIARSALLGFGLQMMTGGWGNGTQQLAAGLGAGATSGAATSEAMRAQMEADDKASSADANQSANRANSLKIAQLGADSRKEIAGAKIEGLLQRTMMNNATKTPDEIKQWNKDRDFHLKSSLGGIADLSKATPEKVQAAEDYANRLAESRKGGATSINPSGTAMPGQPGQTPAPGTTGKPPAKTPVLDQMLADPAMGPRLQADLATPEGREKLRNASPKARQAVEEWEARNGGGGMMGTIKKGIESIGAPFYRGGQ